MSEPVWRVDKALLSAGEPPSPPRYHFLDGLRGLAAFYVLLHHAAAEFDEEHLRGTLLRLMLPLRFGHYAVAVFIVLSGFCLALPVVNDVSLRLRGGFWGYLRRRARRIFLPYFAALFLFLGLIATIPALQTPLSERWSAALPALTPGVILSHLFLIHDFSSNWVAKIDPPMWSVAVEWQIYLLFPLILVLWRRWGVAVMLATAFSLGNLDAVLSALLHCDIYYGYYPWYLALFCAGAWAAWMTKRGGEAFPWIVISSVLLYLAYERMNHQTAKVRWNDQFFGVATATFLVACARSWGQGGLFADGVERVLGSKFALRLGAFSYSLYLTHYPLLSWSQAWMRLQHWPVAVRMGLMFGVTVPGCLAFAYLFYRLFERPTLRAATQAQPLALVHRRLGRSEGSEPIVAEASKGAVSG